MVCHNIQKERTLKVQDGFEYFEYGIWLSRISKKEKKNNKTPTHSLHIKVVVSSCDIWKRST